MNIRFSRRDLLMFKIRFFLLFSFLLPINLAVAENVSLCNTIESCLKSIVTQVERVTAYPDSQETYDRSGVVSVSINQRYEVTSVELVESSGSELFDKAILSAPLRAKSFPQLAGLPNLGKEFQPAFQLKFIRRNKNE